MNLPDAVTVIFENEYSHRVCLYTLPRISKFLDSVPLLPTCMYVHIIRIGMLSKLITCYGHCWEYIEFITRRQLSINYNVILFLRKFIYQIIYQKIIYQKISISYKRSLDTLHFTRTFTFTRNSRPLRVIYFFSNYSYHYFYIFIYIIY